VIIRILLLVAFFGVSAAAEAKLNVITSTTDLRALVEEVGAAEVSVESFAKGTQDPHFIEAKPSFMVKASRADLVVVNGLELEVGWIPSILRGARNPKVLPGSSGYLELASFVSTLEKSETKLSRSQGDVHPEGNPHVTLDPIRMGEMSVVLAKRLGDLDPAHAEDYARRASLFVERMRSKSVEWQKRILSSGVKEVVTYHKMLTYFLDRFGVANSVFLEPKPGIPPTASHLIAVQSKVQERKIPLVLVENYFDLRSTRRLKEAVPGLRVAPVAVSVGGSPSIKTLDDLYESLVVAFETKAL
jgi:zinc/manganese transport system substrate-binding protein